MRYFLCLGSNLGDRETNLERARSLLKEEGIRIIQFSSVYETQPVDLDSPQPWFFNQVIEIETGIEPSGLLDLIKRIEKFMGRNTLIQKGPRVIDIDILLAEDKVIHTEELSIPHPRFDKRNFVLIPFTEISPETVHPILKESIRILLEKSSDRSTVKPVKKAHVQSP
ncbi:MAG: 2-amino-4-hydroxy-6-hydroxymethyldihydropteridine diphosphokinase [Candidatus Aminicenantes bacterium]|nr:MAG: 2-amino-4-hydroxy-6-hydroxymethyldihydropteridine diphosphokinase [Candidatus Aminicenantes bacterium]